MKSIIVLLITIVSSISMFACEQTETYERESCEVYSFSEEFLGYINGYEIRRTQVICEMVVGKIIVDGYDFGFFWSGCSNDLNSIGYYAELDGKTYGLQNLVDDGKMTVKQIYNFYMCDPDRIGEFE